MYKRCKVIIFVAVSLFFCACSRQAKDVNILSEAENMIEQQPDSALQLLNTVLFPEDLNKSRFNQYNLLLLRAKDKNEDNDSGIKSSGK